LMPYWENMAPYRAIRPLCPEAAQARGSIVVGLLFFKEIDLI